MRRPIVGVFGGGGTRKELGVTWALAEELGALIAKNEWILLCGGGSGIMEASALGAKRADGHTIAISRSSENDPRRYKEYAEVTLYTGLGDGRNYLTAGLPDAAVAMAGEGGTLSEIGLALKLKKPLVLLGAWSFLTAHFEEATFTNSAADAIAALEQKMGVRARGRLPPHERLPAMPSQADNMVHFAAQVAKWS